MTATVSAPARLAAFGISFPERILRNEDFAKMGIDTTDEWIVQRTGIQTRHVVSENEWASNLAFGAVEDLFAHHPEITPDSIEFIIVNTTTADYVYPSLAAMIQTKFGMPMGTGAVDIQTACAGFAYGINLATGLVASGQATRVLVVAADALTRSVDYTDRASCVLFGDGAGATIVERSDEPGIFGMHAAADGSAGRFLYRTNLRTEINGKDDPGRLLRQDGRDVYRWVMENVPGEIETVLGRAGMTLDDVDWFVPHSANLRMLEALTKRMPFSMEKTLISIIDFGNTSAPSIPLALVPAVRDGRVKRGDKVLIMGFGGGLVMAGSVVVI